MWCLQGGYGTTGLLDRVDFAALARLDADAGTLAILEAAVS